MKLRLSGFIKDKTEELKKTIMNLGLRFRLTFFFAVLSLLLLLILGLLSYYNSTGIIKNNTARYTNDIVQEINTNMLLRFKSINEIGNLVLSNSTVKEILSKEGETNPDLLVEDESRMRSLLKAICESSENIKSAYILPVKNNNIFAYGDITEEKGLVFLNKEYRKNYRDSELYKITINSRANYIWWSTQNVLGENVFILSEKLYDSETGSLGILVIHVGVEIMDGIYNSLLTGKNSEIYLADTRGRILYHPEKRYIGKYILNSKLLDKINKGENGSFTITENNKELFLVFNTYPVTLWKSVVVTSYESLIADSEKIKLATLLISVICLIFVMLLSVLITSSIVKPVQKLSQLMKRGSVGDINIRFNTRYNDEIGQLGDSFNRMMSDIGRLIAMVEEQGRQKVEAEIKVLEAHIDPHFLYNTLASIYWSAMAKGDTQIASMSAALSNFFRLGLNKGREYTPIEKEIEHVKEFLFIQSMLYKNLFTYEINSDPEVLAYSTIKLLLQPLVENSIIHAFGKKKKKGVIRVEVERKDDRIVFRVIDNGAGIADLDERRLEEIIQEGYGLKNIRDRLKLYFNNDFTFNCTSIPEVETVFEITIPVIMPKEGMRSEQVIDNR
jgi:two-component system sensor histidine kinase YesM